jgi:hypothetical protein
VRTELEVLFEQELNELLQGAYLYLCFDGSSVSLVCEDSSICELISLCFGYFLSRVLQCINYMANLNVHISIVLLSHINHLTWEQVQLHLS